MPLTAKGKEILSAMKKQYGEEKGEQVFYASVNAGKLTGVHEDKDEDLEKALRSGARAIFRKASQDHGDVSKRGK